MKRIAKELLNLKLNVDVWKHGWIQPDIWYVLGKLAAGPEGGRYKKLYESIRFNQGINMKELNDKIDEQIHLIQTEKTVITNKSVLDRINRKM